jgi:predicted transcriptional regulator
MVDATPAREHVRQLIERGMLQRDIAAAADVSPAGLSMLLHGNYAAGRPAQEFIGADRAARLLAVEFVPAPGRSHVPVVVWCPRTTEYEAVGYRVGRCARCGELAPLRPVNDQQTLIAHPTLNPPEGDDL